MAFDQNFPNTNFTMGSTGAINSQDSVMASDVPFGNQWMSFAPSSMPWTTQNRPNIVRFGDATDDDKWTFQSHPSLMFGPRVSLPCCSRQFKRKQVGFPEKPAKVHLTEEKMAAQLKNMHISKNYGNDQDLGDMDEPAESLLPTLVLSREVQNLRAFEQPIIPESILQKMEKPTKALVLWQPPAGKLPTFNLGERRRSEEEKDSTNNNDAASAAPDLNFTSRLTSQSTVTEMEL